MKLPPVKRLTKENYPSQRSWISKLLDPINEFMISIYSGLSNNLTFRENLQAMIKVVDIDKTATHPASDSPAKFTNTMKVKPIGAWIMQAVERNNNPATLTSAITMDWTYSEGFVRINNITGLTNDKNYTITVCVIGG